MWRVIIPGLQIPPNRRVDRHLVQFRHKKTRRWIHEETFDVFLSNRKQTLASLGPIMCVTSTSVWDLLDLSPTSHLLPVQLLF